MAKPKADHKLVFSPASRQNVRNILRWSRKNFGFAAAERYRLLLSEALHDLQLDPFRPGSKPHPEVARDARTYHLSLSRSSLDGQRVKEPRHLILYRVRLQVLTIGRILHDSRDLARHVPHDFSE